MSVRPRPTGSHPADIRDAAAWLEQQVGARMTARALDWTSDWIAEDPPARLHLMADEAAVARFVGEVARTISLVDPGSPLHLRVAPHGFWAEGVSGRLHVRVHGSSAHEALRALRRGIKAQPLGGPS